MSGADGAAHVRIWEHTVATERAAEFERTYGPSGDWVALFRGAGGYIGTELLRDRDDPRRFVTIDRWASRAAWEAFRARFAADYERLDARCEALTLAEREVGRFDRAG